MVKENATDASDGWSVRAHALLDDLARALSAAKRGAVRPGGESDGSTLAAERSTPACGVPERGAPADGEAHTWRDDVLTSLTGLRDVLVGETAGRPSSRGSRALRERSRLLADLSLQRGQVRTAEDLDRLFYDLRRLLVQARLHLHG